jgi:Zn-dependent peptidase ImmA (M78 family)
MPERMPITPAVLKWARERAGYTIEDISNTYKLYKDWEIGVSSPTYIQLESLSDKFKCPIAVFFFPVAPEIESIEKSFRTLPEIEFEYMPRTVRMLIRKAEAMQINLMELKEGLNPSEKFIIRDLSLDLRKPINETATEIRNYLSIPLEEQIAWKSIDEALKNWRDILTNHGVYVFKDAFHDSGYSGFCIYDNQFPIIFVNNTNAQSRQIFTLFHELTHLLFRTSGIDKVNDNYISTLSPDSKQIEIFCNEFAANFLVPETDFSKSIKDLDINDENIRTLAMKYNVSREVILRKFLDRDSITPALYEQKTIEWANQARKRSGDGGDYYFTQIAYLGKQYITLALKQFHQNRIDATKLSEYLNIKPKYLDKFEDKFSSIADTGSGN